MRTPCVFRFVIFGAVLLTVCRTELAPAQTLLRSAPLVYPPEAKARGLTGSVVLHGVIGKDGVLRDLRVVSGPVVFRQVALDAARSWVYKPYTFGGFPVDQETNVTVNFNMTKKEKAAAKAAAVQARASSAAPVSSSIPATSSAASPH